jgi:hypothetical protein
MEAQWDELVEEYYWATVGHAAADHVPVCWNLGFKWAALRALKQLNCCVQMTFTNNKEIY